MPYTLSHAALALPFAARPLRRLAVMSPLPIAAFAFGAMAPDWPLSSDVVVPGSKHWMGFTHTLTGVVTVDLALAVVMASLWVAVVRRPLFAALGTPVTSFLEWKRQTTARRERRVVITTLIAAVLGSLSHIGIDAFTHAYGLVAREHPDVFEQPIGPLPLVGSVPLYSVLQQGLSALGLACMVIAVIVWLWRTRSARRHPVQLTFAVVCVLAGAAAFLYLDISHFIEVTGGITMFWVLWAFLVAAPLGAGFGLLLWSVAMYLVPRRMREVSTPAQGTETGPGPTVITQSAPEYSAP